MRHDTTRVEEERLGRVMYGLLQRVTSAPRNPKVEGQIQLERGILQLINAALDAYIECVGEPECGRCLRGLPIDDDGMHPDEGVWFSCDVERSRGY